MSKTDQTTKSTEDQSYRWWDDPDLEKVHVEPYKAMAVLYDQVMSYVDYRSWFMFILDLLGDYSRFTTKPEQTKILECGAGTGIMANMFALYGYRVDAFDSSTEMIRIARKRSRDLVQPPYFYISNFLELEVEKQYNVALCLYDSVNYLLDPKEVVDFFSRVEKTLKQTGLFLFDICTDVNSRLYFSNRSENKTGDRYKYRREMKYCAGEHIQENLLYMKLADRAGKVFVERHRQRIYLREEMLDMIAQAKLKLIEETDEYSRRPPDSDTLRIHFLCGK